MARKSARRKTPKKPGDGPSPLPLHPIARTVETDAQWAAFCAGRERDAVGKGIYRFLFQLLCTAKGAWKTCARGRCRRDRRCTGRRDPHDWSFAFKPLIPPCVPLEPAIVESLRREIRAEIDRVAARPDRPPP